MMNQKCPICNAEAEYSFESYGVGPKCFNCPSCSCFVITDSAEKIIKSSPTHVKAEILKKINEVKEGLVLVIKVKKNGSVKELGCKSEKIYKWFK